MSALRALRAAAHVLVSTAVAALATAALGQTAPADPQAAAPPAALAANTASEAEAGDIVVTARGVDPARVAERLRRAVEAYRESRARNAPAGQLYFRVLAHDAADLAALQLSLRSDDRVVPLTLDDAGRFTIPDDFPVAHSWELQTGNGPSSFAFRPLLLSPGTTVADRRLGDLRLQCRVAAAVAQDSMPLLQRAAFGAMGGCSSSSIQFNLRSEQPLAGATIAGPGVTGGSMALTVSATGRSVAMPIANNDMGDEARLTLTYR